MSSVVLLLVATVGAGTVAAPLQDPAAPPPRVLNVTYTDGRTVPHISTLRQSGAWTPMFPKLSDWRSPEGLSVTAIDYKHRIEGAGVRVQVSVLLGTPHQKEVRVATVLVEPDQRVTVEPLRAFGVAPVVLSIGDLTPSALHQPQVENKTAALHVEAIDISIEGAPGYRITVRNTSSMPVMTFHVATYRGSQRSTSGRQGHRDGAPAVLPGSTYSFRVTADNPRDLIVITGLMFEDGTVEGDAAGVATTRLVYLGRRLQLEQVLASYGELMRAPLGDVATAITTLASRLDALRVLPDAAARQFGASLLPVEAPATVASEIDNAISEAMLEVRRGALSDLESAPRERPAFEQWLKEITALYRSWYLRFIELTAQ